MRKLGLFLSTMLLSTQVFAAATLRIPFMILDESTGKTIPVKALNVKLVAAGLKILPESITIATGEDGYEKIENAKAQLANAVTALGGDSEAIRLHGGHVPAGADTKQNVTCYTGNPLEVPDIVQTLTDVLYSDQLTMHALKYKDITKGIYDDIDFEDSDIKDFFEMSDKWKNWKNQNEDLLILSSTSDGGDDIQESLIKRCK